MHADQIYQLVEAAFAELGAAEPIRRNILVQDRYFVGQRYRCGDLQAQWMADKNVIEVLDAEGRPLKTILLGEPLKRAA